MPIKNRKDEWARFDQPSFGRIRVGGPKTTPRGTSAAAQKRRTLNPVKWRVKKKEK